MFSSHEPGKAIVLQCLRRSTAFDNILKQVIKQENSTAFRSANNGMDGF